MINGRFHCVGPHEGTRYTDISAGELDWNVSIDAKMCFPFRVQTTNRPRSWQFREGGVSPSSSFFNIHLWYWSPRYTFVLNTAALFLSLAILFFAESVKNLGLPTFRFSWLDSIFVYVVSAHAYNCRRRSEQYLRVGPTSNYIFIRNNWIFTL